MVFGVPLQQQEIEGVKDVVREGAVRGLTKNYLNKEGSIKSFPLYFCTSFNKIIVGFIYLHTLFIKRGRLETIWAVLRKFGYDDNLSLREEFLRPPMDVPSGGQATTELSPKGYQFFTDLFQTFDKVCVDIINNNGR